MKEESNMNKQWFVDRLKEKSTWRGLIALLGACGVCIEPGQAEYIIAAALAVMGALGVSTSDKT